MTKLLINILLFIVLSATLYLLVFVMLRTVGFEKAPLIYLTSDYFHRKGGKTYQSFKEFDKNVRYDAIAVGSSHVRTSIDPRIFEYYGYSVFNFGTRIQSPLNTYFIIKNYITSSNCSLLVYDVLELPFCSDGFESSADLIQNISSDKAAFETACALKDIRSINMFALRFVSFGKSVLYYDSTYSEKGFCERKDSVKKKWDYTEQPFVPNNLQILYFEKALQLLKERNIKTVLIDAPVPSAYKMQYHDEFLKIIKPLAEKYGIPFIDYSAAFSLDVNNHFYDNIHLNQAGADIFNPVLISDLERLNLLKKED